MADPREAAGSFARSLVEAAGADVESVVLYGSVARGEAVAGVSDINILVLLARIDSHRLARLSPLARRWAQAGNTPPLLLTAGEWSRAADAFAIELADMHDAREILHGRDPVAGTAVDPAALRLQAERELRGKLLQLREGMLLGADDPAELGRLLLAALPSFTTYLRAALRLAGAPVPRTSEEVIEAGARLVGGDPAAFLEAWRARRRGDALRARIEEPLATGYASLAERILAYVDTLPELGRR